MPPVDRKSGAIGADAGRWWRPIGALAGCVGVPVVAYQCWACAIERPDYPIYAIAGFVAVSSLAMLWIYCLLILASEIADWLSDSPALSDANAIAPFLAERDELGDALKEYGRNQAVTVMVDRRWSVARRVVWLRERGLILLNLATVAIVAFWLIPRCAGLCSDPMHMGFANWCIGLYQKVGPLAILSLANMATISGTVYPRPFRKYKVDYDRILRRRIDLSGLNN